ncbi:amidohydrolase family protein [Pontibacter sp. H249]|uniref:amidohydrolase family protein n=1 Tax=Pontibacter sp. H249 TaxID=3133420 RepID=UPI0030C1FDEC
MRQGRGTLLFTLMIFCSVACTPKQKVDTIIKDVRVFDGEEVYEKTNVVINKGQIVAIAPDAAKYNAAEIIEAYGYTIVPSLIDTHVHISSENQLRDALSGGVFTLLDLHSAPGVANSLKAYSDSLYFATLLSSGPAITVAGGHGTQFGYKIPTVSSETDPYTFVKERAEEGADVIKIIREPMVQSLSYESINALVQSAHQLNKVAIAHVSTATDAAKLAELSVDGFAHVWFDRSITPSELELLKQKKPFVTPTLLATKGLLEYGQKSGRSNQYLSLEEVQAEVKRLHKAGIVLLAGTDAPNLNLKFGSDLVEELKLLSAAGLSEVEALKTATANPVRVYKLDKNSLPAEGRIANFLLVKGDPTIDLAALNNISRIWKKGRQLNLK